MTRISRLVRCLAKLNLIPVRIVGEDKISFCLFSMESILCFLMILGVFIVSLFLEYVVGHMQLYIDLLSKMNTVDMLSLWSMTWILFLIFPFAPFFLGYSLAAVPQLSLAYDLNWPKCGKKYLWSSLFSELGFIGIFHTFWIEVNKDVNQDPVIGQFVLAYMIPNVRNAAVVLVWLVPFILISSLLDKFMTICKNISTENVVDETKKCLQIYSAIDKGFGPFFLYVFFNTQLLIIFYLFMALSKPFGTHSPIWVIGGLLNAISLFYCMSVLTNSAFEAFVTVTGMLRILEERLLLLADDTLEKRDIMNLIRRVDKIEPLSGNGYFKITKETMTGISSVGITYIIILVQFKMSSV